jgi:hypothetical protein
MTEAKATPPMTGHDESHLDDMFVRRVKPAADPTET